jgi:hypothetical protein
VNGPVPDPGQRSRPAVAEDERQLIAGSDERVVGRKILGGHSRLCKELVTRAGHHPEEGAPQWILREWCVHRERVLRDQRRHIGRPRGPPPGGARPDALLHGRRNGNEVERIARFIHVQLHVFLLPAVVVMVRRGKDRFTPRMIRQASKLPCTHDASRERGVIRLGDQEQVVLPVLDDHLCIMAKIANIANIEVPELPTSTNPEPARRSRIGQCI